MLRRTALLVVAVLLTAGLPPARADWWDPLPEGAPPNFSWERMTGYWARRGAKNYMLYISREGMLHSIWHEGDDISSFIGRWKPVRELVLPRDDILASLFMVTDERFCANGHSDPAPHFRSLEFRYYNNRHFLEIDFADLKPPPAPLSMPDQELWAMFRAAAPDMQFKFEGYWDKIDESAAPDWFKDQVRRLVHSGRFDCEPVPQTK